MKPPLRLTLVALIMAVGAVICSNWLGCVTVPTQPDPTAMTLKPGTGGTDPYDSGVSSEESLVRCLAVVAVICMHDSDCVEKQKAGQPDVIGAAYGKTPELTEYFKQCAEILQPACLSASGVQIEQVQHCFAAVDAAQCGDDPPNSCVEILQGSQQ